MMEKIDRSQIKKNIVTYYRRANETRPDLYLVKYNDREIIVKDFKKSGRLFRTVIGPFLIRREYEALRRLDNVRAVPRAICMIDRHAFAMEYINGVTLDRANNELLTNEFYEELKLVIHEVHRLGIVHCDMRSKGNVMLGDDGLPYVVDFAACLFRSLPMRWVFDQFVITDNNAVVRIKKRTSPQLISAEEDKELVRILPYERMAKRISCRLRDFIKWFSKK